MKPIIGYGARFRAPEDMQFPAPQTNLHDPTSRTPQSTSHHRGNDDLIESLLINCGELRARHALACTKKAPPVVAAY